MTKNFQMISGVGVGGGVGVGWGGVGGNLGIFQPMFQELCSTGKNTEHVKNTIFGALVFWDFGFLVSALRPRLFCFVSFFCFLFVGIFADGANMKFNFKNIFLSGAQRHLYFFQNFNFLLW